jgi:Zn-dependent protease with chaperone function
MVGVIYVPRKRQVRVTQRAKDLLDPGEIDFLTARQMVKVQRGHARQRLLVFAPGFFIPWMPMYPVFRSLVPGLPMLPLGSTMVIMLGGFAYIALAGAWVNHRQEFERSRFALLHTRDRAAAESALWKLTMAKPLPHAEDPFTSSSPALAKRLKALRAVVLS